MTQPTKILEERGWWRGPTSQVGGETQEVGPSGEVCIASAVRLAVESGWHCNQNQFVNKNNPRSDSKKVLRSELLHLKILLQISLDEGSLAEWNDDPCRTLSEVWIALRALEVAPALAEWRIYSEKTGKRTYATYDEMEAAFDKLQLPGNVQMRLMFSPTSWCDTEPSDEAKAAARAAWPGVQAECNSCGKTSH